jgi:protein FAM32A
MSYTTVIGGKLKLKGSGVPSKNLNSSNSGQKSTLQTSIPPRLPISQPYAPGEREEMSKGYLKNAFAKESTTDSNIDIKTDKIEKEITPTEKHISKETKQKKEGRQEEGGDEKEGVSRKRGRSEDDSQFDKKEERIPSSINKTQQSLSAAAEAATTTTSSSSSSSSTTTTTTTAAATVSDSISTLLSTKTSAQLRFEEAQRKRLHERAKKEATKSHREKIEDLNKLLETMPEHYDLFRISYGGQG